MVAYDIQISHHVPYLAPVKEAVSADYPVGNSLSYQCALNYLRLGVHAVKHGIVGIFCSL